MKYIALMLLLCSGVAMGSPVVHSGFKWELKKDSITISEEEKRWELRPSCEITPEPGTRIRVETKRLRVGTRIRVDDQVCRIEEIRRIA